jgi:SAM-dependent methyltransferase
MDERRLKRFFHGWRHTPLHPQWLVFRRDRAIRGWLGGLAAGRVLDIGCADGGMRDHLAPNCEYVGLDYPGTAIAWYGTRPQVFGDAASLPFSHDRFDTVLLLDVLEHLADPRRALGEAWRVLRPGGRLLVKVPFLYPLHDAPRDFRRWSGHGLRHDLEDGGFVVEEVRAFGTPLETAMLLANLGQAKWLLDALARRGPAALALGLSLPLAIPLRNLLGWFSAVAAADVATMPYAVCAVARR